MAPTTSEHESDQTEDKPGCSSPPLGSPPPSSEESNEPPVPLNLDTIPVEVSKTDYQNVPFKLVSNLCVLFLQGATPNLQLCGRNRPPPKRLVSLKVLPHDPV